MIHFEKELEKFKPILNVNQIEAQINEQSMMDIIDLFKHFDHETIQEIGTTREGKDKR